MAKTPDENAGHGMVRWDAVAAFVFGLRSLGGRGNSFRAGIHRACRPAGICRPLQRSGASFAAALFLSAASAPSIRALELVADCVCSHGVAKKQGRLD